LREYETDIKSWYEDLNESIDSKESLLSDIELIWYSRYGITDDDIEEIDREYLPAIYQKIKSVYPDIAEYFKVKMIAAGVSPSIFSQ
jgi:hypothetical protein